MLVVEKDGVGFDEFDDLWCDFVVVVVLGMLVLVVLVLYGVLVGSGKLGVCDVLFGGKVFYLVLGILVVIVLVIGGIGGVIGCKIVEVVDVFIMLKVILLIIGNV